jgi:hypothetical protein
MKKTVLFLLFLFFLILGFALPNSIFFTSGAGFAFRGVVLLVGLLMYTIALYSDTENLMSVVVDEGTDMSARVVHLVRFVTVVVTFISLMWMILLFTVEDIDFTQSAFVFFSVVSKITIFIPVLTLLAIFISNDIERKEKIS